MILKMQRFLQISLLTGVGLFLLALLSTPSSAFSPTNQVYFNNDTLSAELNYPSPAKFYFNYENRTGQSHPQDFVIQLSTYSDMSWDVYQFFGRGGSSPIVVNDPTKWDKYSCGRTLYWRVYNQDNGVASPIRQARVNCFNPHPTSKPYPTPAPTVSPQNYFYNPAAGLYNDQALFKFDYTGSSNNFWIDMSTYPDMSWDVYLNFASGGKFMTVWNPMQKWDKYSCGRTLYWKVYNQDRTVSSPIYASVVSCSY